MIRNFFKIAIRNLLRSKGFSAINIAGLAIGMASAALILLWIQNELRYDRFHKNESRLYEVWNRDVFDGKLQCWNNTPKIMSPYLKLNYPEVEEASRVAYDQTQLFTIGDKWLDVTGTIVDPDFLTMFSFPLVEGNEHTALNGIHSLVITQKLAKKLFGDADPMGKVVRIDNLDNFIVSGVIKDLPNNTRFDFEYLLPWSYERERGWDDSSWSNNGIQTFILLKPHVKAKTFDAKIRDITQIHTDHTEKTEVFIYGLSRLKLYDHFENGQPAGGRITMVRVFGMIAAFILLIACINFMNLSTARSERRAKEVGVRKTVGARKFDLIWQFLAEAVLVAGFSGVLALFIVQLSLPAFNQLTQKQLVMPFGSVDFWLGAIVFILFTGLLAGSYPAFFLAAFRPIAVLKGGFKKGNALVTPRKVLVVLQFSFAIALIISTLVIDRQIKYAMDRETGYNRSNLIYTFLTGDMNKNFSLIRNQLISSGAAVAVSKTSAPLTQNWSDSWGLNWQGKDPNAKIDFDQFYSDGSLVKVAGMKILEGRDIDPVNYPTDSLACLLNQSAVKVMGFKDPLGQLIQLNGETWHVVGIVKNFILESPYQLVPPMFIGGPKGWFNAIHIRLNPSASTRHDLAKAGKIFKQFNPGYPFEYTFIDKQYAQKFNDEQAMESLASWFSFLTIFISCLGLLGLAAYMAQSRIKEIGVRKVLGASAAHISALLSKEFIKLVGLAILVATPVAWLFMDDWLQGYPYRIRMPWLDFVLAGVLALVIALATICFQTLRAAMANPVKSLRTE